MCSSTHSLTSAPDLGKRSASHPCRLTTRERAPGTHWIGGLVGPRAVLDAAVVKRKIPSPRRESNPRTPIVQPVAQRYTDWAVTALVIWYVAEQIPLSGICFAWDSRTCLAFCALVAVNRKLKRYRCEEISCDTIFTPNFAKSCQLVNALMMFDVESEDRQTDTSS
jgi:hypothetical protein